MLVLSLLHLHFVTLSSSVISYALTFVQRKVSRVRMPEPLLLPAYTKHVCLVKAGCYTQQQETSGSNNCGESFSFNLEVFHMLTQQPFFSNTFKPKPEIESSRLRVCFVYK